MVFLFNPLISVMAQSQELFNNAKFSGQDALYIKIEPNAICEGDVEQKSQGKCIEVITDWLVCKC